MEVPKIEKITNPQSCGMGDGEGEFIFQGKLLLKDFIDWYRNSSKTWGIFTIHYKDGEILRKMDYDLYNRGAFSFILVGKDSSKSKKFLSDTVL